mgnify:CR=1 FL=1
MRGHKYGGLLKFFSFRNEEINGKGKNHRGKNINGAVWICVNMSNMLIVK